MDNVHGKAMKWVKNQAKGPKIYQLWISEFQATDGIHNSFLRATDGSRHLKNCHRIPQIWVSLGLSFHFCRSLPTGTNLQQFNCKEVRIAHFRGIKLDCWPQRIDFDCGSWMDPTSCNGLWGELRLHDCRVEMQFAVSTVALTRIRPALHFWQTCICAKLHFWQTCICAKMHF